jgi:hypothetical protein
VVRAFCGLIVVIRMCLFGIPDAHAVPPTQGCGPDQATALQSALTQLPPEPLTGRAWNNTPLYSNYDACADLSTIVVMIQGGTGSSSEQALLFHEGNYVGTGTSKGLCLHLCERGSGNGRHRLPQLQRRQKRLHRMPGPDQQRQVSMAKRPCRDAEPAPPW